MKKSSKIVCLILIAIFCSTVSFQSLVIFNVSAITPITLLNSGFENGMQGWSISSPNGTEDSSNVMPTGGHTGSGWLAHYSSTSHNVYTYQTISGLANGLYMFKAWTRNNSTDFAYMKARNYGGDEIRKEIPHSYEWQQIVVMNINVTNGQCEIGFSSSGTNNQMISVDDVEFSLYLSNPGFENGMQGWSNSSANGTESSSFVMSNGGHSGDNFLVHYNSDAHNVYTYQTLTGIPNGVYIFKAWIRNNADSASMIVKNYGGTDIVKAIPRINEWQQYVMMDINVTNGQCEIGFLSSGNNNSMLSVDDVEFSMYLSNPGFEGNYGQSLGDKITGWSRFSSNETAASAFVMPSGVHSGASVLFCYNGDTAYNVYVSQVASGLPVGYYTLKAWVLENSPMNWAYISAKRYGGSAISASIPYNNTWTQISISDIYITDGRCEIGFNIDGPTNAVFALDDVSLTLQDSKTTGTTYYVSTLGNDSYTGTLNNPFKTVNKAASVMIGGDTCMIRAGIYRETVTPINSGSSSAPIRFIPFRGESVTINGADSLSSWVVNAGSIYKASMTWDMGTKNQVFVDGKMMNLARWPNTGLDLLHPISAQAISGTTTSITDPALDKPSNYWSGATVCALGEPGYMWQTSTITSSSNSTINFATFNDLSQIPGNNNPYFIFGKLALLDVATEWFYDSSNSEMYLWDSLGDNPSNHLVEAKRRLYGFDLSNKSYIEISGINLFACAINMTNSTYCKYVDGNGKYIGHDVALNQGYGFPGDVGITMTGSNNEIRNCTFVYGSHFAISDWGFGNKIINNLIHDFNYTGQNSASLCLGGANNLTSNNTVYNAGRFIVKTDTHNARIQYNDFYNSSLLTRDSGITYTFGWDGQGTVIHHNYVHDNFDDRYGDGIYLDNNSKNFVVHHNVIWGLPKGSSLRLNTDSTNQNIYNNTCYNSNGSIGTWGATVDMSGTMIFNNIFTGYVDVKPTATLGNNILQGTDPKFIDALNFNFHLRSDSTAINAGTNISDITDGYVGTAPDIGAYELGGKDWSAGCDLQNPPSPVFN